MPTYPELMVPGTMTTLAAARWVVVGEVGALDLTGLVELEHVALLHVVEAIEQDPALEALGDLAHVVLEPLSCPDRRVVDHRAVADQRGTLALRRRRRL